MIELAKLKVGKTPLRTRSGLKVQCWRIQKDMPDTFFPIRAIIVHRDGTTEEIAYNYNGRRYINVESDYDLYVDAPVRKKLPYDCMPEPLRAIQCVQAQNYSGIRSANKCSMTQQQNQLRYNYTIGESDEGLG